MGLHPLQMMRGPPPPKMSPRPEMPGVMPHGQQLSYPGMMPLPGGQRNKATISDEQSRSKLGYSEALTKTNQASFVAPREDVMDIDDPIQVETRKPPFSLQPPARDVYPFSLLDPN
ncbi:hypothetical protein Fot_02677 [Forsythia ovata]|uniref:Uncharacterized protein n=1 Tax=Forsythia ovata TaxID=205694 RepID=A0ABD1X7J0_9LAMI